MRPVWDHMDGVEGMVGIIVPKLERPAILKGVGLSIGMYLHGFEKCILPDINKRSSLGEIWEQAEA